MSGENCPHLRCYLLEGKKIWIKLTKIDFAFAIEINAIFFWFQTKPFVIDSHPMHSNVSTEKKICFIQKNRKKILISIMVYTLWHWMDLEIESAVAVVVVVRRSVNNASNFKSFRLLNRQRFSLMAFICMVYHAFPERVSAIPLNRPVNYCSQVMSPFIMVLLQFI